MSEVSTSDYKKTPLSLIAQRLDLAKYDATMLVKAQFETMEDITNNEALILDPTHPAVTIMEMDACMNANNIQESVGLLRRMYPALAESPSDLYLHMADDDYINRFASPSRTKITFAFLYSDLMTKLVKIENENSYKAVIPRDTRFTVDGVTFTLLYPVIIRRYETGALQIIYDSEIENPMQALSGIVITPTIRRTAGMEEWVFFDVDVVQLNYTKTLFSLDSTYNFSKDIQYTDAFYYGRVYYSNTETNDTWVEIPTTHTDQVFDVSTPTVLFTVLEDVVRVEIPIIYLLSDKLSGTLRVDLFTTKGGLSMNLLAYASPDYDVNMTPLDEERDTSVYTNALSDISYYVYSTASTAGGKRALTFEELRSRVIYNAIGPQEIPITNNQNLAAAENNSFEIVKNVDVLTNRKFLATRKLPTPTSPKLITPANVGVITYADVLSNIIDHEHVVANNGRYTILSGAVFKNINGAITMLRKYEIDGIYGLGQTAMVSHINQNSYYYTPFHYVMDETQPEFDLRAYFLDQPYGKDLSFERQNKTAQLSVNTAKYELTKTIDGYLLVIETASESYYKEVADNMVGVQLAFRPYGETAYAYINGTLAGKTDKNERIFKFEIKTNYDIDVNHLLTITNASVSGITQYKGTVALEAEVSLLHYTGDIPQTFLPDATDQILGKFLLDQYMVGNCHETLVLHFGVALDNLWRRSHSYSLDTIYRTYDEDVQLLYTEDVYDVASDGTFFDIVNNELVYRYKHRQGEPVLDTDGNVIYLHKKGDVVLDEQHEPTKLTLASTGREMDLLVIDGKYYFADDAATVKYRDEMASVMAGWIKTDIELIKQDLLEQSWIYFYPKTTLGDIEIQADSGSKVYVEAEQSFNLILHVTKAVYDNDALRTTLENATISLLDYYISQTVVNMTTIRDELKKLYGDSVAAFRIGGLGGSADYELITVLDGKSKLCLKKKLMILPDMTMFVKDAANFEFKKLGT